MFCATSDVLIFLFSIHAAIKLTLPTRRDLINKLISKRSPEEIDVFADEIVRSCNIIERTTQDLFETYQMTKLAWCFLCFCSIINCVLLGDLCLCVCAYVFFLLFNSTSPITSDKTHEHCWIVLLLFLFAQSDQSVVYCYASDTRSIRSIIKYRLIFSTFVFFFRLNQ